MAKTSAGILLFRCNNNVLEFLLIHPGGPFYKNKDLGVWSIPKGEFDENEDSRAAAIREFKEELGTDVSGAMIELTPIVQKSGKKVLIWAVRGDFNVHQLVSNIFPLQWPPKSGTIQNFVEVDRAEWFNLETAKTKIIAAQIPVLEELAQYVDSK